MNRSVDAAKARGLKVLMVVQRTPAWASGGKDAHHPPTDPSTFGAAMGGFAAKIPGVDAWELWNEEDETIFWAGGADPVKYAAMVKSAYPAIKAAQPNDIVVTGATVGNNFDFIEALYGQGIKGYFDAVGVHTDTACLVNGPDVHYRDEQGKIGRYTFTGYREVHSVMARHGDGDKPIWMTELGWNTQDDSPGSCNTGMWAGQKPLGVSEDAAGRVPHAGLPLSRRRSLRRGGALVRPPGHPQLEVRRRATASSAPMARPSRRPPPSRRSPAASRRNRAEA